jgi:hypothetical protein
MLFRNRTIKMVSKNCLAAIIIVSPSKGIILNNKTEFYQKNVYYYVSPRTFQPALLTQTFIWWTVSFLLVIFICIVYEQIPIFIFIYYLQVCKISFFGFLIIRVECAASLTNERKKQEFKKRASYYCNNSVVHIENFCWFWSKINQFH